MKHVKVVLLFSVALMALVLLLAVSVFVSAAGVDEEEAALRRRMAGSGGREMEIDRDDDPSNGKGEQREEGDDDGADDDGGENPFGVHPSNLHPGAKLTKVCPEPGSPKIGDIVHLHIPSVDHMIPRFHGLRIFAPLGDDVQYEREKGHIKKHSHDLFNEHHQAKVLYAFDEVAVRAVLPAHAYDHGGKNVRVKLTDLFVMEDYPHRADDAQDTSKGTITMCFFKASFF